MPLDSRLARFLALLAAGSNRGATGQGLAARRAGLDELLRLAGDGPPVEAVETDVAAGADAPVPFRIYSPLGTQNAVLGGIVYFHGGGLIAGSTSAYDPVARELAHAGGCRVFSVEYRLAPEHRFPSALDDALTVTRHVMSNAFRYRTDPTRLGISGDSAGATLAAATCRLIADQKLPQLALQLLLCPILDHSRVSASRHAFASGYLLDRDALAAELNLYLPTGANLRDPRISPLRAESFVGLPPTIVHTAEFDPMRDEGLEYFERLRAVGTGMAYTCHAGMIHLFYGMSTLVPAARVAYAQIGREIRDALGSPAAPQAAQ